MNHTARDIMTENVIVVKNDDTVNNLIRIFVEKGISCAPVVNCDDRLVGIVTKTDILGYFMDIDLHISVKEAFHDFMEFYSEHKDMEKLMDKELNVGSIMTPDPITAGEETTVESLARTMIDNNIHRLIITKDTEITGIVSTLDILYHVAGKEKHERR